MKYYLLKDMLIYIFEATSNIALIFVLKAIVKQHESHKTSLFFKKNSDKEVKKPSIRFIKY